MPWINKNANEQRKKMEYELSFCAERFLECILHWDSLGSSDFNRFCYCRGKTNGENMMKSNVYCQFRAAFKNLESNNSNLNVFLLVFEKIRRFSDTNKENDYCSNEFPLATYLYLFEICSHIDCSMIRQRETHLNYCFIPFYELHFLS